MKDEYLVGYYDAINEVSGYITEATRRHKNNVLAVLNDTIVKLHNERVETVYSMEEADSKEGDDMIHISPQDLQTLINNIVPFPVKMTTLHVSKEEN